MYDYIYDPITHPYKEYPSYPPYSQAHHEINNYPYDQYYYGDYQYGIQNEFNYNNYNESKVPKGNYHYSQGSNNKNPRNNPYINQQKFVDAKSINQPGIQSKYPAQIKPNNDRRQGKNNPHQRANNNYTDIQNKYQGYHYNIDNYGNIINEAIQNTYDDQNINRNNDTYYDYDKFPYGKTSIDYPYNNQSNNQNNYSTNTVPPGVQRDGAVTSNENNQGFSSKPDENKNKINTEINQPENTKNNDKNPKNLTRISPDQQIIQPPYVLPPEYLFHITGLYNIGSTCYMNATLQCLLHVSPLISYFIRVYPKDKDKLEKLNESIFSKGKISEAFFEIIKSISEAGKKKKNTQNNPYQNYNKSNDAVSPEIFQKTVGKYNPQFQNLEANDSKDLILYLLQVMHQELNYYTKNIAFNGYPNQFDRYNTFWAFFKSYDATNFSIISDLFYGTSENTTKCLSCEKFIYNFQKFEFLSFGVLKYENKEFNLYNGFDDYIKTDRLAGDNQYYCNYCKKLCDADIYTKILKPPKNLLINIDYGKNKKYMPKFIKYDDEIDITKYLNDYSGKPIRYKILGICSHFGDSGSYGHYIAFCRNKQNSKWYKFNDAMVSECGTEEIKRSGNPYLLLYEKIE